jgi:5-methylcytosine-specific restriction protein A
VPRSAPTPCKSPGCPELVKEGTAWGMCVGHVRRDRAPRRTSARRKRMNDEDFKRDAWYSSKSWAKLRRAFIARHPLCRICSDNGFVRSANVVDHIVERKDDDSKRLNWDNLQSLCHSCHNNKTAEEKKKRERT